MSLLTLALVANSEERAIKRMLHVEMNSFRDRLARNPDALPPSTTDLSGHFLPIPDFHFYQPVEPGQERFERVLHGDHDYSVLLAELDDKPYALIYERTYVDAILADLALYLHLGTGLMTLFSLLLGRHLAGRVVRPIDKLLGEITEKTARANLLAGPPLTFSLDDYPNNEIGRLVLSLDQFALRLHGFLERESYFAADVSHELRTPVAIIRGAAEVLIEYPNLPDAIEQRLRTIHRQVVRMGQILDAMLLLAREDGEAGDPALR